jgi:hypothetical protein
MFLFRKMFYKHFIKQIPLEAEKNLHRYISALTYKIIKTIDNIHHQALQFINNEINTVETILQHKNDDHIYLQQCFERLKEIKNQFHDIT